METEVGENNTWLWPTPIQAGVAVIDSDDQRLNAKFPVNRIFCVGRNYEAHAAEMNAEVDREAPFYFTKSASAIAAEPSSIPYPPGTDNFHHEVELVIALGKPGFEVNISQAQDLVFGFACGIDFTRRDLQNKAKQGRKPWDLSKDIEFGAVISAIRQRQSNMALEEAAIELRVNGITQQHSNISEMIWKIPEIISHLSHYYHLARGDLIYTGTPAGVGACLPGDHIEASIEDIGELDLIIVN